MCDFDEERPQQPVASVASAAPSRALSAAEIKEAAASSDDECDTPSVSVFSGAGRRIKGDSRALPSDVPDAMAPPAPLTPADPPALCWKLQFHWYDGKQDSVKADPTKEKADDDLVRTASTGSTASAASGGSAAGGLGRTKSDGAIKGDGAAGHPFQGAAHSLKQKKP